MTGFGPCSHPAIHWHSQIVRTKTPDSYFAEIEVSESLARGNGAPLRFRKHYGNLIKT